MTESKKVLVGKIVAAQGLRGELRVQMFTSKPEDLSNLKIDGIDISFLRTAGPDVAIAKIAGIEDRNAAETLRGTELYIDRATLPELPEDEYYHADLIGMAVVIDGVNEGFVSDIQNFGAGDILELDNGKMVSFFGAEVDTKNQTIYIK